ncbi:hypothetical protein HF521_014177 [Silurus meridionalis]|uniref:Uncharacterized protein n=1 Tax=Silurus meridionalis TaxID=175797 RepID=A0A8T0AA52_SILME|nr:hypothetical protein HF521_014177 [Silurus meridionalis]
MQLMLQWENQLKRDLQKLHRKKTAPVTSTPLSDDLDDTEIDLSQNRDESEYQGTEQYGNCSEAESPAKPEGEEMQKRDNIKKGVMIEIKLQDEGQQAEGHKEPSEMDQQYH